MVTQRGANGEDLTWKVRCRAKFGKAMVEGPGGGEDPKPEPRREQKGGEKKNGYMLVSCPVGIPSWSPRHYTCRIHSS